MNRVQAEVKRIMERYPECLCEPGMSFEGLLSDLEVMYPEVRVLWGSFSTEELATRIS